MKLELKEYQKEIINEDKKKIGLFLGTGSSKTAIALHLANNTQDCNCLVICPKQQKLDMTFERESKKFGLDNIKLTVVSKEQLKKQYKDLLKIKWDCVILDECHRILSGLSPETRVRKGIRIPKMSQLFEITKLFLKEANPERLYLLSATPASKAMRVYAIALFFGKTWDYFAFRDKFYYEIKINSYSGRWVERKNPELKQQLIELVKSFGYVGSLQDWYDVPPQVHIEEYFDMSPEQKKEINKLKSEESDQLVYTGKERAIQNGILYTYEITRENGVDNMKRVAKTFNNPKLDRILELAEEFPRMLIFARYTAQIEMLEKALKKEGYDVVCLTGKTKDRKNIIVEADKRDCIVIAQSEISEGYELKTFRTTVFASKSAMAESYIQSLGRTLRMDALNKNLFIHLVVKGGADERCHKTILAGGDFQERLTSKSSDIIEE